MPRQICGLWARSCELLIQIVASDVADFDSARYEMMVGRPPFRAQNHVELLKKIEKGEDRIKFPDESSRNRFDDDVKPGDGQSERPVPVARDVKDLIRRLLKRVPVQRMSFQDFFASRVWEGYMRRALPSPAKEPAHTTTPSASRDQTEGASRGGRPLPPAQTALSGSRRLHEPRYFVSSEPLHEQRRPTLTGAGEISDAQLRRTPSASPPVKSTNVQPPGDRSSPGDASAAIAGTHESRSMEGSKVEGNEYVIVEKRAVEVNSLADGKILAESFAALPLIHLGSVLTEFRAAAIRPGVPSRRRSSRSSALGRPLSTLVSSPHSSSRLSPASQSPPFGIAASPPFASARAAIQAGSATFPSATGNSRPILVPQPNRGLSERVTGGYAMPSTGGEWKHSGSPGVMQSTGLTRAISNASMKWFASPVNALQNLSKPPWKRRVTARSEIDRLTAEDALQEALDDFARKAAILAEFGDSKLQTCLTAVAGAGQGNSNVGEHGMGSGAMSDQPPNRRRSSSGSVSSADLLPARLEVLCAESLVLYMKALAYLQRGMELVRRFWQDTQSGSAIATSSPDVNESE